MNILMATSECLPYSKTGGLADVSYALSAELVKLGHHVSICVPYYKELDKKSKIKYLYTLEIRMNWRYLKADVFHLVHDGIEYYFIGNDYYFRRNGGLYGYFDDGERYAFFDLAVIELMKKLPYELDILHVHDWQTGMLPCLLKVKYNQDPKLGRVRTVLTIHNPMFKGYFNPGSLYDLYELDYYLYDQGLVRLDNQVSTLKAGIHFADKITTVSPTHAEELLTPEGSKGLWYDLSLRRNDFVGIINGMDYKEFNHCKDPLIYTKFNNRNRKAGKRANKVAFCREFNLDPNKPIYSVVSRLTDQKGLDLIFAMAEFVCSSGGIFCVLGSGEKYAEDYFNNLYMRYPNNCKVYIGYSNELAHKMYVASDFFIMPSAFEPCGLGQMIAQRYGTLPIVRRTGGLKDSVIPYNFNLKNSDVADGFGFDNYSTIDAIVVTAQTMMVYNSMKKVFERMVNNAITADHSWKKSCLEYVELYKTCLSY